MTQEESGPENITPGASKLLPPTVQRFVSRFRPRTPKHYAYVALVLALSLFAVVQFRWTETYSVQLIVLPAVAGSEPSFGINPTTERLDFGDLQPGLTETRFVTLENGKLPNRVTIIIYGGIRDFLSVDDAFFTMDPNETRRIAFHIAVPSNAETRKHSGRVVIIRTPWLPW